MLKSRMKGMEWKQEDLLSSEASLAQFPCTFLLVLPLIVLIYTYIYIHIYICIHIALVGLEASDRNARLLIPDMNDEHSNDMQ